MQIEKNWEKSQIHEKIVVGKKTFKSRNIQVVQDEWIYEYILPILNRQLNNFYGNGERMRR